MMDAIACSLGLERSSSAGFGPDRPADFGAVLVGHVGIPFARDVQLPHRKIGGVAVGSDPLAEGAVAVAREPCCARSGRPWTSPTSRSGCPQQHEAHLSPARRPGSRHRDYRPLPRATRWSRHVGGKRGLQWAGVGHRALRALARLTRASRSTWWPSLRDPAQSPQDRLMVGSLTTGLPEVLERSPGGGVGSGQRCS